MLTISFKTALFRSEEVGSAILLRLPRNASAKLPSRGVTVVEGTIERTVEGTINEVTFRAVLEPDGKESHWFKVNEALLESAGVDAGDTVAMTIKPTKECPEPEVPVDLMECLTSDPEAHALWTDITPMARWDWIRWIGSAKHLETRKRRVDSVCSRLKAGKRRPCCFDRNQCTLTDA